MAPPPKPPTKYGNTEPDMWNIYLTAERKRKAANEAAFEGHRAKRRAPKAAHNDRQDRQPELQQHQQPQYPIYCVAAPEHSGALAAPVAAFQQVRPAQRENRTFLVIDSTGICHICLLGFDGTMWSDNGFRMAGTFTGELPFESAAFSFPELAQVHAEQYWNEVDGRSGRPGPSNVKLWLLQTGQVKIAVPAAVPQHCFVAPWARQPQDAELDLNAFFDFQEGAMDVSSVVEQTLASSDSAYGTAPSSGVLETGPAFEKSPSVARQAATSSISSDVPSRYVDEVESGASEGRARELEEEERWESYDAIFADCNLASVDEMSLLLDDWEEQNMTEEKE